MNTIRTFLLIFLSLTIVLPISSTFLFLAGTLLTKWGDSTGGTFFSYFALTSTAFWFVAVIGLVLTLAVEKVWEFHSTK